MKVFTSFLLQWRWNINSYIIPYLIIFILCSHIQLSKSIPAAADNKNASVKPSSDPAAKNPRPKLLVFMIDGFRWDYYKRNKEDLDAFEEFLSEGVEADYMEPIFPTLSYPAWTTISTGVFPETHQIIGNFMYDQNTNATFNLQDILSTKKADWWQHAEPIWISATRDGRRTFLRHWSRCEVPYKESMPNGECTGFRPDPDPGPGINNCEKTLRLTLQKLEENDLLMIYCDHLDNIGHKEGPDSPNMVQALKELNRIFKGFLDTLIDNKYDLYKELNIIIIGDHGMKYTANATLVKLEKYIDPNDVLKVVGGGGFITIQPLARRVDKVYSDLQGMPGVDVFKRENISEEFHYKKSRLVLDILVVAKDGYYIGGLGFDYGFQKQIPTPRPYYPDSIPVATHGYLPSMPDMRTIFWARGPEFKKNYKIRPVKMQDVYKIMVRVLKIRELDNNGSWSRVSSMFINSAFSLIPNKFNIILFSNALIVFFSTSFC